MTSPTDCPDFCADHGPAGEHLGEYEGPEDDATGAGVLTRPVVLLDGTAVIDVATNGDDGASAIARLDVGDTFALIRILDAATAALGHPFLDPDGADL